MDLALKILQIIFYSIGSIFMITFSVIGIWSFILYVKSSKNIRLQTYVLEKIYQSINRKNNYYLNSNKEVFEKDLEALKDITED